MSGSSRSRNLLNCGALVVWALTGCQDSTSGAPHNLAPASLAAPESVTVLEGDSVALHATLTDSLNDTLHGYAVVWTSDDTSVVLVDSTGMVHFRQPGRTTISALSAGLAAHTNVDAVVQYANVALGSVYGYFAPWCGVTTRGSLRCMLGVEGHTLSGVAVPAGGLSQFTLGTHHGCGLGPDGSAYCWGSNQFGQLGGDTALGTSTIVKTRVTVTGGLHFQMLTAGFGHTCGLTAAGAAYCWGLNTHGQLGNGDTTGTSVSSPTPVAGGLTFQSLAAGDRHTCGLTTGGSIYCWGTNDGRALGTGDTTVAEAYSPQPVASAAHFVQVVAGDDYACGLADGGTAYCWGNDNFNQLGVDSTTFCPKVFACSNLPQAVSGGLAFQSLAAHAGLGNDLDGLTCGLTSGGAAYCWGRNIVGELGDGTTTTRAAPVAVAGGYTFASLSVGDFHACGTTTAGTVYCWGFNFDLTPSPIPEQP